MNTNIVCKPRWDELHFETEQFHYDLTYFKFSSKLILYIIDKNDSLRNFASYIRGVKEVLDYLKTVLTEELREIERFCFQCI